MIVSDTGPLAVLFKAKLLFIRGIIGLFAEAKKKSIIKSVKECIDELLEVGYYLDDELIEEVLCALQKKD